MKILIIGADGQLGTDLCKVIPKEEQIPLTIKDIDITDKEKTFQVIKKHAPDVVINTAAYHNVDKCEDEPALAFAVNAEGVKHVAEACKQAKAVLVHISTDYVFSGEKLNAYTEDDEPNPQTAYGQSKLAGEQLLIQTCKNYFILRTAWLYGRYGNNFVKTMLRKFKTDREVKIVADQKGSPTLAYDLANTILQIIHQKSTEYGIYHTTNQGTTTWFHFAQEIYKRATALKMIDNKVSLIPVSSKEYVTKAKRPMNSVLSTGKLKRELNIEMRPWQKALKFYLENEVTHAA